MNFVMIMMGGIMDPLEDKINIRAEYYIYLKILEYMRSRVLAFILLAFLTRSIEITLQK